MKCTSGKYKGETCLMKNKYPVTKNGKLSCKHVRAAEVYGSAQGVIGNLKAEGLCKYVKRCTHKSDVCPK
jgi:hypothetical protein